MFNTIFKWSTLALLLLPLIAEAEEGNTRQYWLGTDGAFALQHYRHGKRDGWTFEYASYDYDSKLPDCQHAPAPAKPALPETGCIDRQQQQGPLLHATQWQNDLWQGKSYEFAATGEKVWEMTLRSGRRNGPYLHYYPDGHLKRTVLLINDQRFGYELGYHEDGTLSQATRYIANKPVGIEQSWDKKGQLSQENHYVQGQLSGTSRSWKNGQLSALAHYKKGVKEGVVEHYDEQGKVSEKTHWHNGQQTGLAQQWKNGQLIETLSYQQGKKEGEERDYYEDGTLKGIYHWHKDSASGEQKSYFKNGKLQEKWSYDAEHRRVTQHQKFDKKGTVVSELSIIDTPHGRAQHEEELTDDGRTRTIRTQTLNTPHWYQKKIVTTADQQDIYLETTIGGNREGLFLDKTSRIDNPDSKAAVIAHYHNGLNEGEYQSFADDGSVTWQGQYHLGKKVGDWLIPHQNETWHTHFNRQGQYEGTTTVTHDNGQIETITFHNGKRSGPYQLTSADHKILTKGYYKNDLKEGEWWHERGFGCQESIAEICDGTYHEEAPLGEWKYYDEKGTLVLKQTFTPYGLEGDRYEYNHDGDLTEKIHYHHNERDGKSIFYGPDHKPKYINIYEHGKRVSRKEMP